MNTSFVFAGRRLGGAAALGWAALMLALCFGITTPARAQVAAAGDKGGLTLSAGALGSGAWLQYGGRKMLGLTAVVDADTRRRIGVEAEARWLEWRQTANVHAETYSIGARYHFDFKTRFQPYAKGLIGEGYFNFPYNLGSGHYLVLTAGGGLDYRLNRRIYIRAADFEYQDWPQFTYGNMTTAAVSAGLRVRIF
ncbi:MAG: outer membrane protein [Acidobacteriota bacterium]